MDPNIQAIFLGLLTNGLTAFFAQFGRKDSKLLLGEELLKKMKWEETALQPILQKAAQSVAEQIDWQGIPSLEIVCLFLTSPEAETIVRQLFAMRLSINNISIDLQLIRREFLKSFYCYVTSYAEYAELEEAQLADASEVLLNTLMEGCEQTLNIAIDEGKLSAHEAKSAFRHRLILEELASLNENVNLLTSHKKINVRDIFAFVETYRKQVSNRHKFIIPPNFDRARKIHIDKLYVTPNFITHTEQKEEKQGLPDTQGDPAISYRKILSDNFRIVLLGNPGGGKSTFTHKLCCDLISHYSERLFAGRKEVTPILVVLRDYGATKKARDYSILEFIKMKANSDYQIAPPFGAFEYLLLNGRAVVIFDGLDELLDTNFRQEISSDVESFCSLYPSVPVLVTSREVGYEQAPLDPERFEIVRLASFNDNQIEEYVKNWFDTLTDLTTEQRKQKAEIFYEESMIVPDLRSNPLMLALLCNIYREENYIPKNRPDVYEKCATMLFERWDKSRGIQFPLSFENHIRPAMMYLAYWIYADEELRGGVTEEKLVEKTTEYLSQRLFEDSDEAKRAAQEFIEYCTGRAWVFTDTGTTKEGERLYQFTHQTFLEYFTASYLFRTHTTPAALMRVLRAKIAKREWDVVAQLAFHIQNKNVEGAGDKILSMLIKQAHKVTKNLFWNYLSFAVRCLEFIIPSPAVIYEIVYELISHALEWGIEEIKVVDSTEYYVNYFGPSHPSQEIFTFLFNAANENHRSIAFALEKLFIEKISNGSEEEAYLCSEIVLDFGSEYEDNKNNRSQWINTLKSHITQACTERIYTLCRKFESICYTYVYSRKINIADLIKWHGIESIFSPKPFVMLSKRWASMAYCLVEIFSYRDFIEQDRQDRLALLKELGQIIPSITPPFSNSDRNVDDPKQIFLSWLPEDVQRQQGSLNLDSNTLFAAWVLLAMTFEKRELVKEVTEKILIMREDTHHPVMNLLILTIRAREEPQVADLAKKEMKKMGFSDEQQALISKWMYREVNFLQRTQNDEIQSKPSIG